MDFTEVMFMVCFFACMAITLYKVYNMMSKFSLYDIRGSFMLWFIFMLSFGVAMVANLTYIAYQQDSAAVIGMLTPMLYGLLTWVVWLNGLILVIEVMVNAARQGQETARNHRLAREEDLMLGPSP